MKTINVYSNPEAGAVGAPGRAYQWIGASLDVEQSNKTKKAVFVFSDAPVTVPFDAYHRTQVADGALVPADEESATMCGVKFDAKAVDTHKAALSKALKSLPKTEAELALEAAKAADDALKPAKATPKAETAEAAK